MSTTEAPEATTTTPAVTFETTSGTEPSEVATHEPRTIRESRHGSLTHMMSEIEDGLFVAWETCDACRNRARDCTCKDGPSEPAYITRWRDKRFERSMKRVDRHLKAKIADTSALSYLEIAQIALAHAGMNPGMDPRVLAEALERSDRSVLRANLGLPPLKPEPETGEDGTSGQDRESYSDDQDRDDYTVDDNDDDSPAPIRVVVGEDNVEHYVGDDCTAEHYEQDGRLFCGQDFMAGSTCSLAPGHGGHHGQPDYGAPLSEHDDNGVPLHEENS